jgi:hypothetical protein
MPPRAAQWHEEYGVHLPQLSYATYQWLTQRALQWGGLPGRDRP